MKDEFRRELEFITEFRIRQHTDTVTPLPDRHATPFIMLCLQNSSRLSPARRCHHFGRLSDKEVATLGGRIVRAHLNDLGGGLERELVTISEGG